MCLEEVDKPQFFDEIYKNLGYEILYAKKTKLQDGNYVAINSKKFEIIEKEPIYFVGKNIKKNQ